MELFRHTTIEALARKLAEEEAAPAEPEKAAGEARERARSRQGALRQLREARMSRRPAPVERKEHAADD
jgi:hypothetical protein